MDGHLIQWGGSPILLNGTIARDPEVVTLLEKYRPTVEKLLKDKIGYTKVLLDGSSCRKYECNLGNMISDALIYTRVNQYQGPFWTDASICFIQGGGIRASSNVGEISKFDLKTILPFNNTMLLVNINGEGIRKALEHSVKQYTGDRGEFLQVSGIRVTYDLKKKPGNRVTHVEVLCADCEIPEYTKLEPQKEYRVILSKFLYKGGDGFTMFKVNIFHIQNCFNYLITH